MGKELAGWTHERDPFSLEVAKDSQHMHPRQMLRELERAMPQHAMVSTDIGNICSVSNSYLRFDAPRSMFAAMSFGNCGYAFPVICGAKIACPDRPAIAYVGDGAWGISLNELLTCAREKIGVTVVVFNNGQWGAEKKNHVDFYSRRFQGVNLDSPSWAKVAQAFGCDGVTVDRLADVGPALQAAVKAQADGTCTVLEMMVTQELGDPFRRDALSKPVRYLRRSTGPTPDPRRKCVRRQGRSARAATTCPRCRCRRRALRSNRTLLRSTQMAVRRDRPYTGFNFLVDLGDGNTEGPRAGFQEISGLGMEVSVVEYRNGNAKENNPIKLTGLSKVPDVTLKRGIIGTTDLYAWLDQIRNGDQGALRTVTIQLQNEDHTQVVMTWKLLRARIVKHTSGPFNAKGSEVAIEEMVLAAERLEVE